MEKYILAFDQGTTSSRALIFDRSGKICSMAQKEFRQIFPRPGWVEHDPREIWSSQIGVAAEALSSLGISGSSLEAIGITNQRETAVAWDKNTGNPVYNAIVWQDRRTSDICNRLVKEGRQDLIRQKTGLIIDPYFSGTKLQWILENVPGAVEKARKGELAFGTVDSWLLWKLTGGKKHICDISNASRTMLFNIHSLEWDMELLELFGIPPSVLPEVGPSSGQIAMAEAGFLGREIPVCGVAGDQQAAMFGQMCLEEGMVKNTYGTGCFLLKNTGGKPFTSSHNLVTTIAWQIDDSVTYALEGSIFNAGSVVQWLRDELKIISSSSEIESLALQSKNNGGVFFVPAFNGLGAPYWDPDARGMISGLSRGSGRAEIARAALEGIAFQTLEVLEAMKNDTGMDITELRADGGASVNNFLMQFQADILNIPVVRPQTSETTSLGAAYLAGLATGFWRNTEECKNQWRKDREFIPGMDPGEAKDLIRNWRKAVKRVL